MRRSICYCDPAIALAGETSTWNFIYTPATTLPKGTKLKFDLISQGRDIDWEEPNPSLKRSTNVIFGRIGKGKPIGAEEIDDPESFIPQYEFTLPSKLEAGGTFSITIGNLKKSSGKKKTGNMAQNYLQRRRPFHLYVDPSGKGRYQDPEIFTMDIRGNSLATIKILTPSLAVKNKRFDVIVRFEDIHGNLTNNAPEDTLIELTYENLRENLNWKLFVPETGFLSLPNLYFNEPGVYTLSLRNLNTGEVFHSSPVKCFIENSHNLFWGVLHGESEKIDSTENIENCLRHFRDDKATNFFAVSCFESKEETSNEIWKLITQNITDFNENDRFTTFLGCQWAGTAGQEGLRQIIYAKDNKNLLRKKDTKNNTLKKIYQSHSPKEMIAIPSFTMGTGTDYNFDRFSPDFERVVEIYNAWGCSECEKKEGNPFPIRSTGKKGVKAITSGSIRGALNRNYRFGFVAGGLDDRGIYADFYETDQEQYSPGLTAVLAENHSREALFEALYNRSCYATTGAKIIVGLYLAGKPMGSELNVLDKPGLAVNRHLSGYVIGTTVLKSIEIVRNGKTIEKLSSKEYSFDFTFDDMIAIDKVSLTSKDKRPPFVYYYLRITQADGHMAWSSPIWVDVPPQTKNEKRKAKD